MKKRILFIDDEQDILDRFADIMSPKQSSSSDFLDMISERSPSKEPESAYDCVFCSQGLEGVEVAREAYESGRPFSMVFTDMRMPPGIDGMETIKRIREIDEKVAFVMVTAYSYSEYTLEDVMDAAKYQKAAIIRKPFEDNDILDMVSRHRPQ